MANGEVTTGKVIALIRALSTSSTSSATYTVTDALVIGAATTSGVRLDLAGGDLRIREGDNSGFAHLVTNNIYCSSALYWSNTSSSTPHGMALATGVKLRSNLGYFWSNNATDANQPVDTGLTRDSAAQVVVTDGSTGIGNLRATALIVGTADTSGVRLKVSSGNLQIVEGDDSGGGPAVCSGGAVSGTDAEGYASAATAIARTVASRVTIVGSGGAGLRMSSTYGIGWSSNSPGSADCFQNNDTGLARASAGALAVKELTNNSATNVHQITASSGALSGASYSFANALPAGAIILGVTVRVTTTITGATTFDVGDGSDVDRYGAAVALASGTTTSFASATANPLEWRSANGNVVLTANGSNFTGGVVRICVHYLTGTAPTS